MPYSIDSATNSDREDGSPECVPLILPSSPLRVPAVRGSLVVSPKKVQAFLGRDSRHRAERRRRKSHPSPLALSAPLMSSPEALDISTKANTTTTTSAPAPPRRWPIAALTPYAEAVSRANRKLAYGESIDLFVPALQVKAIVS